MFDDEFRMSEANLIKITQTAIENSFADEKTKEELMGKAKCDI